MWAARDAGTALGLAIVNQPDVAVIDDDLPIVGGLDAAFLVKTYAPASRVVLFTHDERALSTSDREGIATSEPVFVVDHILTAVDAVLAA